MIYEIQIRAYFILVRQINFQLIEKTKDNRKQHLNFWFFKANEKHFSKAFGSFENKVHV